MRYIHYTPTHVLYNGGDDFNGEDAGTAWQGVRNCVVHKSLRSSYEASPVRALGARLPLKKRRGSDAAAWWLLHATR